MECKKCEGHGTVPSLAEFDSWIMCLDCGGTGEIEDNSQNDETIERIISSGQTTEGKWVEGYYFENNNMHYIATGEKIENVLKETICPACAKKDDYGNRLFLNDIVEVRMFSEVTYKFIHYSKNKERYFLSPSLEYITNGEFQGELKKVGNILQDKTLIVKQK